MSSSFLPLSVLVLLLIRHVRCQSSSSLDDDFTKHIIPIIVGIFFTVLAILILICVGAHHGQRLLRSEPRPELWFEPLPEWTVPVPRLQAPMLAMLPNNKFEGFEDIREMLSESGRSGSEDDMPQLPMAALSIGKLRAQISVSV
jgi:hypothetical protein